MGESAAGKAAGTMGATTAAALDLGKGIIDGLSDIKDFCLNPSEAAANARDNFGIAFLNIFGGAGDAILSASGQKTPLQQMQDDAKKLQFDYRSTFDTYTQKFDGLVTKTETDLFDTMKIVNKLNSANMTFMEETLDEKIDMNSVYIMFLFMFFTIVYIYITIS